MEDELELIGAASVGSVARDVNGDGYLQGPCSNCGEELTGEFCRSCGQSAKDMKRPFLALFANILNDVFSLDGRMARTIPALILRPGHVTRSYLQGKRVRYVPPFRMFLIASVLFFLVLFGIGEKQAWMNGDDLTVNSSREAIASVMIDGQRLGDIDGFEAVYDEEGRFDRAAAEVFIQKLEADNRISADQNPERLLTRLDRLNSVRLSRDELFNSIKTWAPRLSLLLLPFYVVLLAVMHIWVRRIYIYDHVIVALHLQAYLYFAATLAIWFSFISPGWAWGIFGVSIPIYLFRLLRKSYDTSRIINVLRIFLLLVFSLIALIILVLVISLVGANEAGLFTWSELITELASDDQSGPINFTVED